MLSIEVIVTPNWLTHAMTEVGILAEGRVSAVSCHSSAMTAFQGPRIAFLNISYTDVKNPPPTQMVLKIADGVKESTFFTKIAPLMNNDTIIRCYHTNLWTESGQSYLLLEDMSETHDQTDWPIPPTVKQCNRTVECLAKIHTSWWNDQRLANKLQPISELGTCWHNRIDLAIDSISQFFDFLGDRLSLQRKQIFENVLSSSNQSWRPRQTNCGLTLVHGDAHFWNFLYSRDEKIDDIRIIHWNAWDIGRGTDDLAYMIGLHWYPCRRKALENVLLYRYHNQLLKDGIQIAWD